MCPRSGDQIRPIFERPAQAAAWPSRGPAPKANPLILKQKPYYGFGILLLFTLSIALEAADVQFYYVAKSQGWKQTGPAVVSRSDGDKYVFNARSIENIPGTVGSGSITLPNGQELPFTMLNTGLGVVWSANDDIGLPAFNTQFPNGNYQFRLTTTHDGTRTPTLSLTGDAYPNFPQVSNYTQAQAIDASKDFALTWFAFQGGRALDYIYINIQTPASPYATVFATGYPGQSNALNGLSTGVTVPANTLISGATYRVYISFARVVSYDTTNYLGATGYSGYGQDLFLIIKTGGTSSAPMITNEPMDQTSPVGSDVTFTVAVTGGSPLFYEWQTPDGESFGAQSTPSLTLTNIQQTNATSYFVVVSNPSGSVTSRVATLTIAPQAVQPSITSQPQSQVVAAGQAAMFSVTAAGTPPLSYVWRKNGNNITGASSSNYVITAVQPSDAGTYSVVVSNSAGFVTSTNATLTIITNVNPSENWVLSLNGTTAFATITNSPDLSAGDFSIMAWVWLNAYDNANSAILAKREPGSNRGWMLYVGGTIQGPEARKPTFIVSESSDPRVVGSSELGTNAWHHIAVVFRSSNSTAQIYLDGILSGSNSLSHPTATTIPLYVGRDSKTAQYFLNGNLDEISIWSKPLTSDDILALKSCRLSGFEPNLVAYLNFDGGSLIDLTGTGHDGAMGGSGGSLTIFNDDSIHANCATNPSQAPPGIQWQQSFGGGGSEFGTVVRQTSDGGYVVGGYSESAASGNKTSAGFGLGDYWVVKLDANGSNQWDRSFGGSDSDVLNSLQQTSDGGYILGGWSVSDVSGNKTSANFGGEDYWLVKLDANGIKQWDKSFGGSSNDVLSSLQQTTDGGYILGGSSYSGISGNKTSAGFGDRDYWVVKVDANGDKQWDKSFGGTNYDRLLCIQQTADGGYIVGGYSRSGASGNKTSVAFGADDYWVMKLDANGNKEWDKSFGGSNPDLLFCLQQTSDGGYVLGGLSSSAPSGNKTSAGFGLDDYWVVKLDLNGNKQWDRSFGGTNDDWLNSLQQTVDGGYILGGYSASGVSGNKTGANFGGEDYWLVKLDSTGNKQWDKSFGGTGDDELFGLQQTSDGAYILAGASYSATSGNKASPGFGDEDYWVIKLAPPLRIKSFLLGSNNVFQAQLFGISGTNYVFQASTNLSNWISLLTNNSANGSVNFYDSNAANFRTRFYRIRQQP